MIQPTIFLIEEDNDNRDLLRRNLRQRGYRVTLAIDEEDARERVGNCPVEADLMLISLLKRPPEEVLRIGRNISEGGNLKIPIVVLPKKYGEDMEGQDVKIGENDYITYPEDGEQLLHLLFWLTSDSIIEE
jgi:DNA-binding response OmpR family regulator